MAKTRVSNKKKIKKYKIELTSLSVLLWVIFFFFTLTWIFVLGILVGRGFLPGTVDTISDLRNQIKKLQEMVGHKEPYDSKSSQETETVPKLDFYSKLESKRDEVKKNWLTEKPGDAPKQKTPPAKVEKVQKPFIPKKENGLPEISERGEGLSIPQNRYTVQVASLGEMDKAEKMIRDLIDQGHEAYYFEANVEGRTFYRIRCGRFARREDAVQYAQRLEQETGLKGFVSKVE